VPFQICLLDSNLSRNKFTLRPFPHSASLFNEQEMTWQLGATEGLQCVCQECECPPSLSTFYFSSLPPPRRPYQEEPPSAHVLSNYGGVPQCTGRTTNRIQGSNWISLTTAVSFSISVAMIWLCRFTQQNVKCLAMADSWSHYSSVSRTRSLLAIIQYALMRRSSTVGLFSYRWFTHRYVANDHFSEVKAVPVHAVKAYRGSRRRAPLILNLGARWKWVVSLTPRPI
jgi:hypothetical protein